MSYLPGMMDGPATRGIGAVPVSIGVSFPESIMPGTPLPDIAAMAGLAGQAGLDGVWVGDRLAAGELSVLDSSLSLAVAAAATSSIAVGYAIFVPSLRPLAWAVRQVATLQHIAGGRLQLGVATYAEAGADLIVVVCDPAPSLRSWELLADVRQLLTL
jgi:alkanesulfonate monooxygenase SsuD/methylene tetrahydromethanopterin reductase-like flavin-dependent oxidoreductase (luciferase family)